MKMPKGWTLDDIATEVVAHELITAGLNEFMAEKRLNDATKKGAEKRAKRIARNMKAKGMDAAEIAEMTGLTIDYIRRIRRTNPIRPPR